MIDHVGMYVVGWVNDIMAGKKMKLLCANMVSHVNVPYKVVLT